MPKFARALVVAFLALLTTTALGVASAFMAALALGATVTALIAPGTGTHDANNIMGYNGNIVSRYLGGTECTAAGNTCDPDAIEYPASFWPLGFIGNWCPGYKCDTWNESVGLGVSTLDAAIDDTDGPITLFGYSQGGAVVSDELRHLLDDPDSLAKISDVVMIGNILNPDGGLWNRLGFLGTIPFLNVTFGPPMPTDFPVHITNIGFQYDPVVYAPRYWGNAFALLNAFAAFATVHGNYLTPNEASSDPMAYGYTDEELAEAIADPANTRTDSNGNTYIMIPAKSLPLANLIVSATPAPLKPIVKPVVDLVAPVWKVLADLGYDWSGDPGVARPLSLLPFNPIQNWPAVGVKLVAAAAQGVQAFIKDLGGPTTTKTPSTPAQEADTTESTSAAKSAHAAKTATVATEQDSDAKTSTPKLTVVKDSDTSEQNAVQEKPGAAEPSTDGTTDGQKDTASTADDPSAAEPDETTKPTKTTSRDDTKTSGSAVDEHKKADGKKSDDNDKKADTAGGKKKPVNDKKDRKADAAADKKDTVNHKKAAA
jgi:PE-PPE domain